MRRFLPLLVVVVAVAALAIDFFQLPRPFSSDACAPPTDTAGCIDTRLGLDLQYSQRGSLTALHDKLISLCNDQLAIRDA